MCSKKEKSFRKRLRNGFRSQNGFYALATIFLAGYAQIACLPVKNQQTTNKTFADGDDANTMKPPKSMFPLENPNFSGGCAPGSQPQLTADVCTLISDAKNEREILSSLRLDKSSDEMMASARIYLKDVAVWDSKNQPKKSGLEAANEFERSLKAYFVQKEFTSLELLVNKAFEQKRIDVPVVENSRSYLPGLSPFWNNATEVELRSDFGRYVDSLRKPEGEHLGSPAISQIINNTLSIVSMVPDSAGPIFVSKFTKDPESAKDWWDAKLTMYFNSLNTYALFKAYELQLWAKAFPKEFGT
jgi:hypothetical protein